METKVTVREFIISNFYLPDPTALADDASLLDSGVLDSTGVLELISFLERTFATSISDEELMPENLDSIDRIVAFVEKKRCLAAAA
jgi:acyl carrier protein